MPFDQTKVRKKHFPVRGPFFKKNVREYVNVRLASDKLVDFLSLYMSSLAGF